MTEARLVVATRQSKLALWQAEYVAERLRRAHPELMVELLRLTTQGDRWLSAPLAQIGGKGLFIKELEAAVADGRADLAVHSVKDVPARLPDGFAMPAIGFREDPRDALVSAAGSGLAGLPEGARVGSSSLRRQAQLLRARPDLRVWPVRGNVDTRLRKLDHGEFDALVLAAAGLHRLGLGHRITEYLHEDVCLPAAGQGALGIECRADDERVRALLVPLNDQRTHAHVTAERAVSAALNADCSAPLAAHASHQAGTMVLRARLASPDGRVILQARAAGDEPGALGAAVASDLITQGARSLLAAAGSQDSGLDAGARAPARDPEPED